MSIDNAGHNSRTNRCAPAARSGSETKPELFVQSGTHVTRVAWRCGSPALLTHPNLEFNNFRLPAGSRANIKYIGLVAAAIACGRAATACGRGHGLWPWSGQVSMAFGRGLGSWLRPRLRPCALSWEAFGLSILWLWPVAMAMAFGRRIGFWFLPRLWPWLVVVGQGPCFSKSAPGL